MPNNHLEKQTRWERTGRPMPISAIEIDNGKCSYNCVREADYLVKVENDDGDTAQFQTCQKCSDENRIWAERYLPEDSKEDH